MATEVLQTALTIIYDPNDEGQKEECHELLDTLGSIIDHTPFQPLYVTPNEGIQLVMETDSRDISTMILTIDDGSRVEVDPLDLFQNTLANAGMTQDQFVQVLDYLDKEHSDLVEDGNAHPDLVCGLEWILQALKMPGYEFT